MINKPMEASFVFLDKENYSINAMLDKLELKSRPGVFMAPIFPRDFERTGYYRQSYMRPAFVADTVQQNKQKSIWKFSQVFGKVHQSVEQSWILLSKLQKRPLTKSKPGVVM
jgi:hypothetical protein